MYATPQGREAVALLAWEAIPPQRPRLDWRLPWREQSTDQLGSLPEPLLLGGLCRGGKFSLDLREHPWQRDREWEDGSGLGRGRSFAGFLRGGLSGHYNTNSTAAVIDALRLYLVSGAAK
jgi:hypothetical protein